MASGSRSEREFAAASETPLVTVAQTTRELKQVDADLWLRTGRGRREAHTREGHLVNMAIAVATGTPSRAVENVRLYRALVSTGPLQTSYAFQASDGERAHVAITKRDTEGQLFSGADLGTDLDTFVRWLASNDDAEKLARLQKNGFAVTFTTGPRPSAEVVWRNALEDGIDRGAIYRQRPAAIDESSSSSAIRRTAVLELPLFECLADLLRSSPERAGLGLMSSPSGSIEAPRNENAAPGRAALRQPRASAADGSLRDLQHSTSATRERQGYARGPSSNQGFGPDDPRIHPAYAAA